MLPFTHKSVSNYSDELDRVIARNFLINEKSKSNIEFGGKWELDLIGKDAYGCDVEFLTMKSTQVLHQNRGFKIPYRKIHYWNNSKFRIGKHGWFENKYSNFNVDYIQLFDNRTKLLYFNSLTIKQYLSNTVKLNINGWSGDRNKFIFIPLTDVNVEFWELKNNNWILTKL